MDLAPIEAEHERIAADFAAHQQALVLAASEPAAAERARAAWSRMEARLRAHIRFEDEVLLPLFEQRVQPAPLGCTPELLSAEHRKLEKLLDRCGSQLEVLFAGSPPDPAAILEQIESERMLREVLEHHDERERAAFFPNLAEQLSNREVEHLLAESTQAHPPVPAARPT